MTAKLPFKHDTAPERGTILVMKMSRELWFSLADCNNILRSNNLKKCWYRHEVEELYADLHPA